MGILPVFFASIIWKCNFALNSISKKNIKEMKKLQIALLIGLGTLILLVVALYNRFPLVYSDTGTYINSGFNLFVPFDRPITYGLFLRLTSLTLSPWFVVIAQNLITAYILLQLFITFRIHAPALKKVYLVTIFFLVFFTGIGWYSNQLMPDFFTPVAFIALMVLLLKRDATLLSLIITGLIFSISLIMHFSHLMIISLLLISIFCARLVLRERLSMISFKRIYIAAVIIFLSWIIIPGINVLIEGKGTLTKGSHVFLVAHLADTGILKRLLDDKCGCDDFRDMKLCRYKDSLPGDLASFMWTGDILENTGGWKGSGKEFRKIIRTSLSEPEYLLMNIYQSFFYGLIQLTQNDIGQGLSAYNQNSAPYPHIYNHFNLSINNYLNSRQNLWDGWGLKLDTLNLVHRLLVMLSVFALVWLIATKTVWQKIDPISKFLLISVILFIFINSFITAGLVTPCERFQARVIWLLPLTLIITYVINADILRQHFLKKNS